MENIIRQRCRLRVLFTYNIAYSIRNLNIIVYRKEKKRHIIGRCIALCITVVRNEDDVSFMEMAQIIFYAYTRARER